MDPTSAIGLVGNIIQLIDFSRRLLSDSRQIYESGKGASVIQLGLSSSANTLVKLDERIQESFRARTDNLTVDEQELRHLCENCRAAALDLLAALNRFKLTDTKHRKCGSIWLALRSALSKDEINNLSSRLQESRQQLDSQMLACIRYIISNHDYMHKIYFFLSGPVLAI